MKHPIANLNHVIAGTCDGGNCNRRAVSLAYDEKLSALIPVCRRHILVYRVGKLWQAEDEAAELQFCRRSRFRWLAQRRILLDQRAAMRGQCSRGQRKLAARSSAEVVQQNPSGSWSTAVPLKMPWFVRLELWWAGKR